MEGGRGEGEGGPVGGGGASGKTTTRGQEKKVQQEEGAHTHTCTHKKREERATRWLVPGLMFCRMLGVVVGAGGWGLGGVRVTCF